MSIAPCLNLTSQQLVEEEEVVEVVVVLVGISNVNGSLLKPNQLAWDRIDLGKSASSNPLRQCNGNIKTDQAGSMVKQYKMSHHTIFSYASSSALQPHQSLSQWVGYRFEACKLIFIASLWFVLLASNVQDD